MAKQSRKVIPAIAAPPDTSCEEGSGAEWMTSLKSPAALSLGLERDFFPYFYKPSLSASSVSAFRACEVAHALRTWTAFRARRQGVFGPEYAPPVITKHAKLGKELQGEYSWMGNLTHDLFEDLLYREVDRHLGRPESESREERYSRLLRTFARQWETSRDLTVDNYSALRFGTKTAERPVWLTGHALACLRNRLIDEIDDEGRKVKMLQWMEAGARQIYDHLDDFIEHSAVPSWKVIEGRCLENGEIVFPRAASQEEARTVRHQPSFWLTVDGYPMEVFCTMDFGFVREREGKREFVVTDLKTGKEKPLEHRSQLELYGVFSIEHDFGFAPDDIKLRLLYPQQGQGHVREYEFSEERLLATRAQLIADARVVLNGYVPLDHPDVTEARLKHSFSNREAQLLAGFGALRRREPLPNGVDARGIAKLLIQSLSPLEMAQAFMHRGPKVGVALGETIGRMVNDNNEFINQDFLLRLFAEEGEKSPFSDPEAFLREMTTSTMLIPIPDRFAQSGARLWEARQLALKDSGEKPDTFHTCTNCEFVWFCEEGRSSSQLFELSMPPRSF